MIKDTINKAGVSFFMSILIPLTALGVSWGATTARLDNLEKRQTIIETRVETQMSINQDIKVSLAQLEKDIQYIKATLDKR